MAIINILELIFEILKLPLASLFAIHKIPEAGLAGREIALVVFFILLLIFGMGVYFYSLLIDLWEKPGLKILAFLYPIGSFLLLAPFINLFYKFKFLFLIYLLVISFFLTFIEWKDKTLKTFLSRFSQIFILLFVALAYLTYFLLIFLKDLKKAWFPFIGILFLPLMFSFLKYHKFEMNISSLTLNYFKTTFIVLFVFTYLTFVNLRLYYTSLRKAGIGGGLQIKYCVRLHNECSEKGLVHRGELIYLGDRIIKLKDEKGNFKIYKKSTVELEIVDKEVFNEKE